MTKGAVIAAFQAEVGAQLEAVARVTADARGEATGSESKAEGKYDTRATEASYLAAGQGRRLAALRQLAAWLDQLEHSEDSGASHAVQVGSLVLLTGAGGADGVERWVLVGPVGGPSVEVHGTTVQLVSLASPLGASLEDAEAGDELELESPRGWATRTVARLL